MASLETAEDTAPAQHGDDTARDTQMFALLLLTYVSGWGVTTLLFGVPGFIYPALFLVVAAFAALIDISRG